MLLIPCPWCGPRPELEFRYGGEAHVARPLDPDSLDDAAWAEFAEADKGILAPGKLADFVVLSEDLLAVPSERIEQIRVDLTVVGGRVVFERVATR